MAKHIIALPFPAEGHVSPMMHLCVYLAERGFSVTFAAMSIGPYDSLALINNKGEWPPSRLRSSIRVKQLAPAEPFPTKVTEAKTIADVFSLVTVENLEKYTKSIEQLLEEIGSQVCCIISDWCLKVAAKHGILGVLFSPLPASAVWCGVNLARLFADDLVPPVRAELAEEEDCVLPDSPAVWRSEIPWNLWTSEACRDLLIKYRSDVYRMADLTIVNSCMELEGDVLSALSSELHNKFLPIGPLFLLNSEEAHTVGFGVSDFDCLEWLDAQPPASVLYIAFGSLAVLSASQVEELASGLEASGVRFLWVIRSTDAASARVTRSEKGIVVRWSPQAKVLAHPSVGAFLSHCGWNSTLEAAAFGKPVLCWPVEFEQNTNAGILVRKWKTGAKFVRGRDGIVDRGEVERVVRAVMEGDEGKLMRQHAEELSEKVRANNTPNSGLEKFIDILSQGCKQKEYE